MNRLAFIFFLALTIVVIIIYQLSFTINKIAYPNMISVSTIFTNYVSPIFSMLSALLLYYALMKQIENNNEQRLKNDTDMIFALLSKLDEEINKFKYTIISKRNGEVTNVADYIGVYGINKWASKYEDTIVAESSNSKPFSEDMFSVEFAYIISSYVTLLDKVTYSKIDKFHMNIIRRQVYKLYDFKLARAVNLLEQYFKHNPKIVDNNAIDIRYVYQKMLEAPEVI